MSAPTLQLHLDPDGSAVFAPIYIAAQAVERLLEPIAPRYMTAEQEKSACKSAREDKLKAQGAACPHRGSRGRPGRLTAAE